MTVTRSSVYSTARKFPTYNHEATRNCQCLPSVKCSHWKKLASLWDSAREWKPASVLSATPFLRTLYSSFQLGYFLRNFLFLSLSVHVTCACVLYTCVHNERYMSYACTCKNQSRIGVPLYCSPCYSLEAESLTEPETYSSYTDWPAGSWDPPVSAIQQ